MGTRAHWFNGPYRWRGIDSHGDHGPWIYAERITDVHADFEGSAYVTAELEKFRTRGGETVTEWTKRLNRPGRGYRTDLKTNPKRSLK